MNFDDKFCEFLFDRLIVFDVGLDSKIGVIDSLDMNTDGWTADIVQACGTRVSLDVKPALLNGTMHVICRDDSLALHSIAIDDTTGAIDSPFQ